jgi:hypothetical protein
MRVIRNCSDSVDRIRNLKILLNQFRLRGYPESILRDTEETLMKVNRQEALKPKSPYLLSILRINNPEILSDFGIQVAKTESTNYVFGNVTNVITPFYRQLRNLDIVFLGTMEELIFQSKNKAWINAFLTVVQERRRASKLTNNLASLLKQK